MPNFKSALHSDASYCFTSLICSLKCNWWFLNFTCGCEIFCFIAYQKSLLSSFFLAQAKSEYLEESKFVLPVQINGKTRGTIVVDKSCSEDDAFQIAASDEKLSKYLAGKGIRKRIYVPGRILNVILDQQKAKAWQLLFIWSCQESLSSR